MSEGHSSQTKRFRYQERGLGSAISLVVREAHFMAVVQSASREDVDCAAMLAHISVSRRHSAIRASRLPFIDWRNAK